MSNTNINIGVCHSRLQQGLPCFFVNWQSEKGNEYIFFSMRFECEQFKNRLL